MSKHTKLEAFKQLHNLIIYYAEYRDRPAEAEFNFFEEVKACCDELDIDYESLLKEFNF